MVEKFHDLSQTVDIDPQAAYCAFTSGFRNKLKYVIRTIPDINDLLQPFEDIMRDEFIPASTDGMTCSEEERLLLSLPSRLCGM